ncbi:hypothetical protein B0T21DRAFT_406075 [Apiosordaria backusii]|uniref:Uncharacterized protein n=1 Tax=Apiosordaria backusii TaxID=314023 RepID=A0AA40K674_9PEZI|nr:hypothetical protein B0T21DRAFT_406075 [Apiosordaria backusii]
MPRSYRSDSSPDRDRDRDRDRDDRDYRRPSRHRSVTPGPNTTRGAPRPRDYSPSRSTNHPDDERYYASGALQERHPHFEYEEHTPFYRPDPRDRDTLQIPRDHGRRSSRPRSARTSTDDSLTSGTTYTGDTTLIPSSRSRGGSRRGRSRSSSTSSSTSSSSESYDLHHKKRGPIRKAKQSLQETFTPSTSGLGVGVLGAIVGGLAAREAVEHLPPSKGGRRSSKSRSGSHSHSKHDKIAVLGTVLGAAIGGLGANAIERHIERRKGVEESWGRREVELKRLEERVREAEGGGRDSREWRREKGDRDRERGYDDYERGRRY